MIKVRLTSWEQVQAFQDVYGASLLVVQEHWPGAKQTIWRAHLAGTVDDAAQIALTLGVEVEHYEPV